MFDYLISELKPYLAYSYIMNMQNKPLEKSESLLFMIVYKNLSAINQMLNL